MPITEVARLPGEGVPVCSSRCDGWIFSMAPFLLISKKPSLSCSIWKRPNFMQFSKDILKLIGVTAANDATCRYASSLSLNVESNRHHCPVSADIPVHQLLYRPDLLRPGDKGSDPCPHTGICCAEEDLKQLLVLRIGDGAITLQPCHFCGHGDSIFQVPGTVGKIDLDSLPAGPYPTLGDFMNLISAQLSGV